MLDMVNKLIKVTGLHNIIGRGLVVHERSGGARLVCAVIGILEEETAPSKKGSIQKMP